MINSILLSHFNKSILWANPSLAVIAAKAAAIILLACEVVWVERALRFTEKHTAVFILCNILLMISCAFLVPTPEFWYVAAFDAAAVLLKYLIHRFPFLMPPPRGVDDLENRSSGSRHTEK